MNKYAARGLMLEAAAEGRRVLCVVSHAHEVQIAMDELTQSQDLMTAFPPFEIRRTNGAEEMRWASGGFLQFRVFKRGSLSSMSADTVFIDHGVDVREDWFHFLQPIIATSPNGQVIRA